MMRNVKFLVVFMLCVLLAGVMTLGASAQTYPDYLVSVTDASELLTNAEEDEINEALVQASDAMGIPICAFVFEYAGRDVWGDNFLAAHGLDGDDDLILMVVEVTHYEVNYYMYTYGDAERKINQKELNYILDANDVYINLKNGDMVEGLCTYAELSAQAYNGRLGVSWALILIIALIVGAVAGFISVGSIAAGYKKKNPSQSYPLDRFAKLELTKERDREIGKFVTTTIISTGGHGGRGGGGGGRPGGGGGGGFRGGR